MLIVGSLKIVGAFVGDEVSRQDADHSMHGDADAVGNGNRLSEAPGQADSTDQLTNAAGHTIPDGSNLGRNVLALSNAGLVEGTIAATPLEIGPSDAGRINTGTLQGRDGVRLLIAQARSTIPTA